MGSDGNVLLTPYVPKGITGYDDDDDEDEVGNVLVSCAGYMTDL